MPAIDVQSQNLQGYPNKFREKTVPLPVKDHIRILVSREDVRDDRELMFIGLISALLDL